jgi:hypothetical protein
LGFCDKTGNSFNINGKILFTQADVCLHRIADLSVKKSHMVFDIRVYGLQAYSFVLIYVRHL